MHVTRRFALLTLLLLTAPLAQSQEPEKLPRVLILGDSISLGYTEPVRKILQGRAVVLRPNVNCQHTGYGLAEIKNWLGDGRWDVIHFNWGIWDTHMLNAKGELVRDDTQPNLHIRHTPEQYRENLTKLVAVMEKTGAKLIWASTTPIMSRKGERFEDIVKLNAVAQEVIKDKPIATDDLYEAVLPNAKDWLSGDQVHFNVKGNEQLAKRVSDSILQALEKK